MTCLFHFLIGTDFFLNSDFLVKRMSNIHKTINIQCRIINLRNENNWISMLKNSFQLTSNLGQELCKTEIASFLQ